METLSERLKRIRELKGFATQDALAKAAKIPQSFVGALEAGNQQTSSYLPELAHALGVDAYYLKTGIEVMICNDKDINAIAELMAASSKEGRAIMLYKAREIAKDYPKHDTAKAA